MDSSPSFSLSALYRSDPVYSLCASDLMTASQTVNNHFIKEQKQLMKTLSRLEQQRLIRLRQLSGEQRTFAFTMNKRLSQRGARPQRASSSSSCSSSPSSSSPSSLPARGSRSAPASLALPSAGSWRAAAPRLDQRSGVTRSLASQRGH